MTTLAEIKDLKVAFESPEESVVALEDLNFILRPGETLALLGESGCGKSLTSLALMRLLPFSAAYGSKSQIIIDDCDLLNLPEHHMRRWRGRKLALIFQEPMTALNPVLTIGTQLAEVVSQQQRLTSKQMQAHLLTLLHEVEISKPHLRLQQYPYQLSGGQRQRIMIAMALAHKPDILIADEPTTALDVTVQAQILDLLKKIKKQYNMSILLITHDLGVVRAMADKVCVLYAGEIVEQSNIDQFFSQLKHPYTQQLLQSLPSVSKRNHFLNSIPGTVPTLGDFPQGCRFHPRCAHRFAPCDKIKPLLQPVQQALVRCHLYPALKTTLPGIANEKIAYAIKPDSSAESLLLSVKNLTVHYSIKKGLFRRQTEEIKAVDNLSFNLKKAQTLALVGESGCGKTTVSRALLRLLPHFKGEVKYKDQSIAQLHGKALQHYRKQVQIIFQDPFSSMNPRMTIAEILAEAMYNQGWSSSHIDKQQYKLLDYVNLPRNVLTRYPHQFSGGQRQRICIARALAVEPELLICDEPTSSLDVSVQAQILNLLKSLQVERQLTYLLITHNMGVVAYFANEVLVMREGKMVEMGLCEQILKNPKQDYTKKLIASVLEVVV